MTERKATAMVPGWLEGLLPGVRETRPTFVAGVLWALTLALHFHGKLGTFEGEPVGGLWSAVSDLHPVARSVVAVTLLFGLGALASGPIEWVAARIGRLAVNRWSPVDEGIALFKSAEEGILFGTASKSANSVFEHFNCKERMTIQFRDELREELSGLVRELQLEVETGGDELLREHAPEAFLDIDRQRAEARVRIALAVPTAVAGVIIGHWLGYVLAGLAAGTFLLNSYSLEQVSRRRLQALSVAGVETPSVAEAHWVGQEIAYEAVSRKS